MTNNITNARTSMFVNELRKTIPAEDLINLFVKYLNEVEDHTVMRYLFEVYHSSNGLKEYKVSKSDSEIIISCHSVFKYSQRMTDFISKKEVDLHEDKTTDVMASLVLYGAVYEVFKSEFSDASDLIKLYEKVCMLMNSPRDDFEENPVLIGIRSSYYLNFYLPMELFGFKNNVSEDLFILYYLTVKDNNKDLKEFYSHKLKVDCKRNDILLKIKSNDEKTLSEVLDMAIRD